MTLRFSSTIALSIVACGILCEGQSYTDWNGGNFNDGDNVNISYNASTSTPTLLNQSINLANGTLTANITATLLKQGVINGPMVGNFGSGNISFGSAGATINFNITKQQNAIGVTEAFRLNSTTLTANANLNINSNIAGGGFTLFNATGGNLTFNGDVKISGNASNAMTTNNSTLNINQAGGKNIDITGAISANGGNTNIKLDGGDKISGAFNGTNNSHLTLEIDNSTYSGNVTNSGTSTINIKNNGKLDGTLNAQGTELKLTMQNGSISQSVKSSATTNTLELKQNSVINGGLQSSGTTNLNLDSSRINGTSTITGTKFSATLQSSQINSLTTSATESTIKVDKGSGSTISTLTMNGNNNSIFTDQETLTVQTLTMIGKNNTAHYSGNANNGAKLTITGDATITANGGENKFVFQKGGVNGILKTSGKTDFKLLGNTNINTMQHSANDLKLTVDEQAIVQNGVNTDTQTTTLDITISKTAALNGSSTLKSQTSAKVSMSDTAKGGNFNFQGPQNTLNASGTNNTLTGLSMQGSNGGNTNNNLNVTGKLTINGNADLKAGNGGNNTIDFNDGGITGTLTTSGQTTLQTKNSTSIAQGIVHSNGDFNADFENHSHIQQGIQTSGNGNSIINIKDQAKISGNSILKSNQNTLTLISSAQIIGNTTFAGNTNALTANNDSKITGQLITDAQAQNTTYTLKDNATLVGGIDTQTGAGKTTASFNNNSKIENGTSNLSADIDLTFTDNSQTNNEQFNINGAAVNIIFKNQAQNNGGAITTKNGTSDIKFTDDSKMTNGKVETTGGNTTLLANQNANLTGSLSQSGGNFNATFKNNSQFNGNGTQTGGTSSITFQDQAKWSGNFEQNGATSQSSITFNNTANMQGNIVVKDGTTNITFNPQTFIVGNIQAAGRENKVTLSNALLDGNLTLDGVGPINGESNATITNSKITGNIQGYDKVDIKITGSEVDGYLHQGGSFDPQGMKAIISDSWIKQGFQGNNDQANTLNVTNSKIDGGIKQIQGSLDATLEATLVTGGFQGSQNSANKVTMTNGSLKDGIVQNTGSLDFLSKGTNFIATTPNQSYGFLGINSQNTLKMANGDFGSQHIKQQGGSLNAEIVSMSNVQNFEGINSNNNVSLSNTEMTDVSQSGGSLDLLTYSQIKGSITGSNNSQNIIRIVGSGVREDILQNTGSMELYLTNSSAGTQGTQNNKIGITNANFGLYADNSTIKNIELIHSTSLGNSTSTTLTGTFSQMGGRSTMTFSDSKFTGQDSIKFEDTLSASLIFTKSEINHVSAIRGVSTLNLSESKMGNFSGTSGVHTVMLTSSEGKNFTQNNGSLSVSATANSTLSSLTGNNATLSLILGNQSSVTGNVSNTNGNTSISMQDSTINGDVLQTGGNLTFNAEQSEIKGKYEQNGGSSNVNFTQSFIKKGVGLNSVADGSSLIFSQQSQVNQGFEVNNSNIALSLLSQSKITEGFKQNGGKVIGSLNNQSSINGDANHAGLTLSGGVTSFTLYNQSQINQGIQATNNTSSILVDRSTIDGNITINQGSLDLTAQNKSTITSAQMQITDADLQLTLDTNSKFIGDLTQTNKTQEITIKQNSTFQGNITNTNTTSTIIIDNASVTGHLTQERGTLRLELSNGGKIGGNVVLKQVDTTLLGSGTNNEIQGNFSQENGSLKGNMNGLTLTGTYTQNGGTSDVIFTHSAFKSDTTITNAINSSLSFENSTLKNYTITGGSNNTLKLLNQSTMTGNLTLQNQASAILKMQDSKIDGNINASNDSFLHFDTLNSEITGTSTIDTGGVTGVAENTKFGGDFTLTQTTSNVSFINGSEINGNLIAMQGDNTIKFDASSLTGNLSQTQGNINLDLSNGSQIIQNLTFNNTVAHFTGSGTGNKIGGKFDSLQTKLTGDVSGLTLQGTFTQQNGTSDIIFRNQSQFNSLVSIDTATSSNIKFENQSGIKANISIKNGTDNQLSFNDASFIVGDTILADTTALIAASNHSTIDGKLDADNSITQATLSNSIFNGDITQNNGTMTLTGVDNSTFTSPAFNIKGNPTAITNINLDTGSNLSSTITAQNATLSFSLNNISSVGDVDNPSTITLTDGTLSIDAQNGSIFNADITDTNTNATPPLKSADITLKSNSIFNGKMAFENISITASLDSSTLHSPLIQVINGKFDLIYTNSANGGTITEFEAKNTELTIKANQSLASINQLKISGKSLDLLAQNNARLSITDLQFNQTTTATYTALTNGNLNVNTHIDNNASTLDVKLYGGMLQGSITQIGNGQGGFDKGNIELKTIGDLGGRLALSDDTQIHSLTLNNHEDVLYTNALFVSAFKNPMSYVDFTLEFDDTQTTSRVDKSMIKKPIPQPGQPILPAPNGSTYVRSLQVDEIKGNYGLFRVYADLGADLADNILASRASGEHIIQVQYRAQTFQDIGGKRIVVAKVIDPNTSVSFKGTQSEIGLTRYDTEIIKENAQGGGFEWIIGQATPAGMSYSSKIIATLLQSQYRNFMVEVDSLDRRMGDLRYIKRDLGLWMRAYVGEGKKGANDFSVSAKDDYYSIWSGMDFNSVGLTVHNFAGIFFNYTGINSEGKDFSSSGYNIGIGLYDTFRAFSGFYADFLMKYIYSSNSFEITNYALAKNRPKTTNHKFLLNGEMGYSFYYGEKFKSGYIQPQFQVTSGYIDEVSLQMVDVSGEIIYGTMARNFPITLRAGVFWGQVFGEKIKSHIKFGSSFAYDVNSGGDLHFKDSSTQLDFKQGSDFRMLLSARSDFTFSDFFKVYASIDTSFFGNYNIVYNANFGLRMIFGRPNNRVMNVPMVYNPYEPPVVINDDKRTIPVVKKFTTKDIDQNYAGKPRKIESQIFGNPLPQSNYGNLPYTPSRKSIRDMTSEVEF